MFSLIAEDVSEAELTHRLKESTRGEVKTRLWLWELSGREAQLPAYALEEAAMDIPCSLPTP